MRISREPLWEGTSCEIINATHKKLVKDFANIRFVFLDRDGVLNRKPPEGAYITSVAEFHLLPDVAEAVASLNRSGRKVIVVTNQRGIALGLYSQRDLDEIHDELRRALAQRGAHLDAIYSCPHNVGECNCRKPMTGMFERAFADFPEATPANSITIGDSLRDIEAGVRMGMQTVLVTEDGHDSSPAALLAGETAISLAAFVRCGLLQEKV
jgi:D-glycero-D-manno-heptose 1,7-bisphosphate phosphatase